ncbi:tryptophan--tRNA ligase [Patescibacteria group bacterium]|nr:tryptophan--tRNA ligase [Patescibacteria group bacterium]
MSTIFSAMQPTGALHLGNYLGALKNWVDLQNSGDYNCIFGIVDLHAMTIDYDPKKMPDNIVNLAIDYLACGIDPKKSLIFIQSHLPEHTELAWILNCLTPIAELERMTQYKDKSLQHKHNINAGLFDYPVLMTADILLYKADTVPVGEDQIQHVEFSRIIARKFNNKFGKTFPEPKALLTKSARLMSLVEPTKKMSKSYGDKHCIFLTDSPKDIKKKIASAVTDSGPSPARLSRATCPEPSQGKSREGEGSRVGSSPGVQNLFDMLKIFAPVNVHKQLMDQHKNGALKYVDLKTTLTDAVIKHLKPIQVKRKEFEQNRGQIGEVLVEGAEKAQEIAKKTMGEVRKKVGIR